MPLPIQFARSLLTNQVRASAKRAGLAGMAAGAAFNMLMRRSPMGAVALGAVILGHRALKANEEAKARRDAKMALQKGVAAPPPVEEGEAGQRR